MSFILDALKKSESERHRNSGPVLMDVRIAPPRRRLPTWAWIIAGVLAINLLVLAWLLWFSPQPSVVSPAAALPAAPAPAAPSTAQALPASSAAVRPATTELPEPTLPAYTAPAANTAIAASPIGPPPEPSAAPAINLASLPRYQDLVSSGLQLPVLQLNLHVHDPQPANSYVLLNGTKLREGESTPDGLKVLQISQAGVALEWHGQKFFMNAGG